MLSHYSFIFLSIRVITITIALKITLTGVDRCGKVRYAINPNRLSR